MSVPADYTAFRAALDAQRNALPKRLRQCAAYFDAHPERVAFDTVAQVAESAGVQPSAVMRAPIAIPQGPNQRWSLAFVSDSLSCGRRFSILNVIDDFSREF